MFNDFVYLLLTDKAANDPASKKSKQDKKKKNTANVNESVSVLYFSIVHYVCSYKSGKEAKSATYIYNCLRYFGLYNCTTTHTEAYTCLNLFI